MANLSLLSSPLHVSVPFVKVTIGDYTFGVYGKVSKGSQFDEYGVYSINKITYPNFIKSLTVQKINGLVNKYTLNLEYAVTEHNDPNFFKKVIGKVRNTRSIVFSYGDTLLPTFIFKEEEAIITKVRETFNINASVKSYTINAVSNGVKVSMGANTFEAKYAKPSDEIFNLLYAQNTGLTDLFYGMSDRALVEKEGLILRDDAKVQLKKQVNMSVLDYLSYLVSCMKSASEPNTVKKTFYHLIIEDDISGVFNGPIFRIKTSNSEAQDDTAYEINIGIPNSKDIVISLDEETDETYSILYDFNQELHPEEYVQRINDRGEIEQVYAPILSSGSYQRVLTNELKNWWYNITEFPTKLSIKLKGLLRPAILMTYIKLNVYFYGHKDAISGLYIVTKQEDTIDTTGYKTTLKLTRIGKSSFDNVV